MVPRKNRSRQPRASRPPPNSGWTRGPSDPPSSSVESWKSLRFSFELQPGSVSLITSTLIVKELAALGITPSCYSPIKIQCFAQPGTAVNQSIPTVQLQIIDPISAGILGEKKDVGSLSTPGHLHYRWPQQFSSASFSANTPRSLANAEITNSPAGTCVFTLRYLNGAD